MAVDLAIDALGQLPRFPGLEPLAAFPAMGGTLQQLQRITEMYSERDDDKEKDKCASEETTRQKGERMRDGTAQEAEQQLEEIDNAQRNHRKGKGKTRIDNIDNSKQRAKHRWSRIRDLLDAIDEYF